MILRDVTSDNKLLLWFMDNIELPLANLCSHGDVKIAKSAMDISYTGSITYNGDNVLVIVEGLSMYLSENDVKQIFSIIEKSFMNTGLQALYIIKDLLIMFYFTVTLQTTFFVPEITVILAFPFFSALILPFL